MCNRCDEEVHASNKIVARHIRVPLNDVRWFDLCRVVLVVRVLFLFHFVLHFLMVRCVMCRMCSNRKVGNCVHHHLPWSSTARSAASQYVFSLPHVLLFLVFCSCFLFVYVGAVSAVSLLTPGPV